MGSSFSSARPEEETKNLNIVDLPSTLIEKNLFMFSMKELGLSEINKIIDNLTGLTPACYYILFFRMKNINLRSQMNHVKMPFLMYLQSIADSQYVILSNLTVVGCDKGVMEIKSNSTDKNYVIFFNYDNRDDREIYYDFSFNNREFVVRSPFFTALNLPLFTFLDNFEGYVVDVASDSYQLNNDIQIGGEHCYIVYKIFTSKLSSSIKYINNIRRFNSDNICYIIDLKNVLLENMLYVKEHLNELFTLKLCRSIKYELSFVIINATVEGVIVVPDNSDIKLSLNETPMASHYYLHNSKINMRSICFGRPYESFFNKDHAIEYFKVESRITISMNHFIRSKGLIFHVKANEAFLLVQIINTNFEDLQFILMVDISNLEDDGGFKAFCKEKSVTITKFEDRTIIHSKEVKFARGVYRMGFLGVSISNASSLPTLPRQHLYFNERFEEIKSNKNRNWTMKEISPFHHKKTYRNTYFYTPLVLSEASQSHLCLILYSSGAVESDEVETILDVMYNSQINFFYIFRAADPKYAYTDKAVIKAEENTTATENCFFHASNLFIFKSGSFGATLKESKIHFTIDSLNLSIGINNQNNKDDILSFSSNTPPKVNKSKYMTEFSFSDSTRTVFINELSLEIASWSINIPPELSLDVELLSNLVYDSKIIYSVVHAPTLNEDFYEVAFDIVEKYLKLNPNVFFVIAFTSSQPEHYYKIVNRWRNEHILLRWLLEKKRNSSIIYASKKNIKITFDPQKLTANGMVELKVKSEFNQKLNFSNCMIFAWDMLKTIKDTDGIYTNHVILPYARKQSNLDNIKEIPYVFANIPLKTNSICFDKSIFKAIDGFTLIEHTESSHREPYSFSVPPSKYLRGTYYSGTVSNICAFLSGLIIITGTDLVILIRFEENYLRFLFMTEMINNLLQSKVGKDLNTIFLENINIYCISNCFQTITTISTVEAKLGFRNEVPISILTTAQNDYANDDLYIILDDNVVCNNRIQMVKQRSQDITINWFEVVPINKYDTSISTEIPNLGATYNIIYINIKLDKVEIQNLAHILQISNYINTVFVTHCNDNFATNVTKGFYLYTPKNFTPCVVIAHNKSISHIQFSVVNSFTKILCTTKYREYYFKFGILNSANSSYDPNNFSSHDIDLLFCPTEIEFTKKHNNGYIINNERTILHKSGIFSNLNGDLFPGTLRFLKQNGDLIDYTFFSMQLDVRTRKAISDKKYEDLGLCVIYDVTPNDISHKSPVYELNQEIQKYMMCQHLVYIGRKIEIHPDLTLFPQVKYVESENKSYYIFNHSSFFEIKGNVITFGKSADKQYKIVTKGKLPSDDEFIIESKKITFGVGKPNIEPIDFNYCERDFKLYRLPIKE